MWGFFIGSQDEPIAVVLDGEPHAGAQIFGPCAIMGLHQLPSLLPRLLGLNPKQ
jgi:hypothetical protein